MLEIDAFCKWDVVTARKWAIILKLAMEGVTVGCSRLLWQTLSERFQLFKRRKGGKSAQCVARRLTKGQEKA